MTFRQATREIERLGFKVIATTSFQGVDRSFDASNGKKLARGPRASTSEAAMNALLHVVQSKVI